MEIVYHDSPFKLSNDNYPFGKGNEATIHVVDNYLEPHLWHWWDKKLIESCVWSKTNQVGSDSKTGLPHHSFWGGTFFNSMFTDGPELNVPEYTENTYTYFPRYFDQRVRTDFGFEWVNYDYMGLNSQTQGLDGTNHTDCAEDADWNLSFLFYLNTFWNPSWGGDLRLYDTNEGGGRNDSQDKYEIGRIEFKPNRLLLFDGRTPHGAEAPTAAAKYVDRRSLVHRGTEIRFADKEDTYMPNVEKKLNFNRYAVQKNTGEW